MAVERYTEAIRRITFNISGSHLRQIFRQHLEQITGEQLGSLTSLHLHEGYDETEPSVKIVFESAKLEGEK